jgi:hypothetical protein
MGPTNKQKEKTMKEKFKQIFEGLKIAYGQYQKGERGENGKQGGKAFIVRGNVTDDLWENHLKGEGPALGIIPITENNTCRWGCIDIDEYNFNHLVLITNIRKLKLPLIVCRSKSGGAHVFLFTKEFISASLMQGTLKKMAKMLGYEGCEIFPKQTEILVERGDTGQQLIKSVNRKGYDKYRCKDSPINSVCNSGLCRMKKYGVGFGEEEMPTLGNLTKYASKPPQWFLDVGEKRIELKSEQLYMPGLFALACLDQANLVIPIPKPKDWKQHYLKGMMDNLQEIEPLESLDPLNEITSLLQDWTTNRQSARTMDDILNKLPYTDENREFTYFRREDFYSFCKKNNWEHDKIKTGNYLTQLECFVEEFRPHIKNQQPRVIKIRTMKKMDASISKVEYQQDDF